MFIDKVITSGMWKSRYTSTFRWDEVNPRMVLLPLKSAYQLISGETENNVRYHHPKVASLHRGHFTI